MGKVHMLIEEHGKASAAEHVTARRPHRVTEIAATAMLDEHMGQAPTLIYSGWCHAGLPHRRIPDDQDWEIETDFVTLVVEPGKRWAPGAQERSTRHVGVPFGPYSRLILYYLMDRALVTEDRNVELGQTLANFLGRLELAPGGETRRRIRDQIERISRCKLTFHIHGQGFRGVSNQSIVETAIFFDDDRGYDERQTTLFTDRIKLSEGFYRQLRQHAVRLDERAIRKIHNNSRALDAYSWLAFRLPHITEPVFVPWAALRPQFGKAIKVTRNFPSAMRDDTQMALSVYEQAKVEVQDRGLLLFPSPPPVRASARLI
jgi:hypothetical protein